MSAKQSMGDREYLEDVLLTAKTLTNLYHYATQEASTEPLYDQFKTNMDATISMQHNIFKAMEQKGWYQTQQAQPQQIAQVKTKFS